MKSRWVALVSFVLLAGISASAQTIGGSARKDSSEFAVAATSDVSGDSAAGAEAVAPPAEPAQKATSKTASGSDGASVAPYPLIATTGGTLGLFTLETGDLLPKGGWSASGYGDRFTRMPGSVVVTGIGLNFAYGFARRWNIYAGFEPWVHTHIGLPGELSLNSDQAFPQFGSTIYRQLGFPFTNPINPGYVEDYPFAANNDGGVGAVTLGVKYGILSQEQGAPVSLSLRNDFVIPTVRGLDALLDNGTQTGEFDDRISLAVSHTWGSSLTVTGNFGYMLTRDPRDSNGGAVLMRQADQANAGVGFIAFPGHRFEVMTEYSGLIFVGAATPNTFDGARDPISSVTGVRLYPFRGLGIDLGYRYMVNLKDAVDRNGFVIKAGFTHWPEVKPAPVNRSPVVACTADKSPVFAGSNDAVNIHTIATDPDGDAVNYSWTASGGRVDGNGADVRWLPATAMPGTYTVTVTVDDGHAATATCGVTTQVQERPNRPPTVSLSGDRASVFAGERVHYAATGSDPDGDRLAYNWRANGGNLTPANASADLDTTGMAPGNYNVTVRVEDGRGGAADASAGVEIKTPPPPPQASKIDGCDFKVTNSSRVDNACKRVLDDIALRLQNEARATIVIIGYADPKERRADALAAARGNNAVEYLASKGVDRSRIVTRTGAGQAGAGQQNRRIDVIWVPEGATY